MLKVQQFVCSPFYENSYLIWDEKTNISAVIDPGFYDSEERNKVEQFISKEKLELKYLINTHCHIDHIFGNSFIKEKYQPIYLAPEKDLFLLDLMIEQAKTYGVKLDSSPKPDKFISEKENFILGELEGKFLFTPGHSPGEYCLYFENDKICFTGDVLFHESIGRTDLWGGDYDTLIKSIKSKLFTLPEDVVIYPGHESRSTIEHEKNNNPFI